MRDNDNTDSLANVRWRIDALDSELVKLLNERAELSLEVGRIKRGLSGRLAEKEPDGPNPGILKPFREQSLLDALIDKNRGAGPLPDEHLVAI